MNRLTGEYNYPDGKDGFHLAIHSETRPVEVNNTLPDVVLEFIDGEWVPHAVQEGY